MPTHLVLLDQLRRQRGDLLRVDLLLLGDVLDRPAVDAAVVVDALEVGAGHARDPREVDAGDVRRHGADLDRLTRRRLARAEAALAGRLDVARPSAATPARCRPAPSVAAAGVGRRRRVRRRVRRGRCGGGRRCVGRRRRFGVTARRWRPSRRRHRRHMPPAPGCRLQRSPAVNASCALPVGSRRPPRLPQADALANGTPDRRDISTILRSRADSFAGGERGAWTAWRGSSNSGRMGDTTDGVATGGVLLVGSVPLRSVDEVFRTDGRRTRRPPPPHPRRRDRTAGGLDRLAVPGAQLASGVRGVPAGSQPAPCPAPPAHPRRRVDRHGALR